MTKNNKKGDTLIEVTIAVGIFSMVAVTVMAVMNGGAASAQTMLEATLAREEVDAQAEALRFIQSSYIAEKSNGKDKGFYYELWKNITDLSGTAIENFNPGDCKDLYGENGEANNGFVINTRALGLRDAGNVLVKANGAKNQIKPAVTYPRLVYGGDDGKLVGDSSGTELNSAEGIYIVAVKDNNSTTIEGDSNRSAFYDFYIRTCWYGSGESAASTLYTLIRLGDPDVGNSGS